MHFCTLDFQGMVCPTESAPQNVTTKRSFQADRLHLVPLVEKNSFCYSYSAVFGGTVVWPFLFILAVFVRSVVLLVFSYERPYNDPCVYRFCVFLQAFPTFCLSVVVFLLPHFCLTVFCLGGGLCVVTFGVEITMVRQRQDKHSKNTSKQFFISN
jgi:hypothetical protein